VVGIAATVGGTFLTWQLIEGKRKIALDALSKEQTASTSTSARLGSTPKVLPSPALQEEDTGVFEGEDIRPDDVESPEAQEEGESPGGAYDPITGEINWDCPCLGGMAHGPCGQQFRDAFSCFVYSEEEPKGINCVEKFKLMQDCFREHPDVYAEEIADDDEVPVPEAVDDAAPESPPTTPA